MTNEEAIKIIRKYECNKEHYDACEMAIKALEQQPCEDAVSRQAVHDLIAELLSDYLHDEDREKIEELDVKIEDLPSVTPKQQPCEDAISRQAVEKMIKAEMPERGIWEIEGDTVKETVCEVCVDLMQELSKLPPVTPKEKTGHWIQQPRCEGDEQPDLVCPNCGFKISWWDMGNFCAKCGKGLEGGAG